MKRTIFIFLDGVGFGAEHPSNPFFSGRYAYLPLFPSGGILPDGRPVGLLETACSLPGIPQSATCQTALFTGCSGKSLGPGHKQGYPDTRLRRLIRNSNLLSSLQRMGKKACYLNAYPFHAHFFQHPHLRLEADGTISFSSEFPPLWQRMISVTTCLMLSILQPPFGETDIRNRISLYQDFSNRSLREQGANLPEFTPEEAGEILFRASRSCDFLLYEFFQTDIYAHRRSFAECTELIGTINRLIETLVTRLDPGQDTLIITSDHGNIEDLNTIGHTRNPVPFIVWGAGHERLVPHVDRLETVTPGLLSWITES